MAKEVTFLDAASKRGVVNIAQQGAQSLGTLASAIGKQKAKEDKAAKEQLAQIQKMITPPKNMDKLLKVAASEDYTGAIKQMYQAYQSGDPNWQTRSLEVFSNFTERIADKESFTKNYEAWNEARRNSKLFIPKAYQTLAQYYDGSKTLEDYYKKIKSDPSVQNLIDPESLHVKETNFKPKIPIQSYMSSVFEDIKPVQVGKDKETVVVLEEKEAADYEKNTGVRPNSVELATRRLLDDYDFLEQYIDAKNLNIDYMNIGPKEREVLQKNLIKDGAEYVSKKYKGDGIKITVKTGEQTIDTPYGFNKSVSFAKFDKTIGGKNVKENAPLFGNIKPIEEPVFTIATYKGSLNRLGEPITTVKNANKKFTGVAILPFKIENGVEKGIFSPTESDLKTATGFQMYYQFEGGDLYVPVSQIANLQFNVGGKDPVKTQQEALDQQRNFTKDLNAYQKKVRSGVIKSPLLYKKIEEANKGLITNDELNTFIKDFKFDK